MCFFFSLLLLTIVGSSETLNMFPANKYKLVERKRETYLNLVFLDCTYKREIKVWWSVGEKQTGQTCAPFFLCLRVVFHVTIIYKKKKKKNVWSFPSSYHIFLCFLWTFSKANRRTISHGSGRKSCRSARSVSFFSPFLAPHRKRHQENHKS